MSKVRHLQIARLPFLGLGMVVLLFGIGAGLERLGWHHGGLPALPLLHGPLMVVGFFGTLVSLERAVALKQRWAYAIPALFGLGALLALIGYQTVGAILWAVGSVGLVWVFVALLRIQNESFLWVMMGSALALVVGNILWLIGRPAYEAVLWWIAFLVLTIAGERLELSRILFYSARVKRQFLGIAVLLGLGLMASLVGLSLAWHGVGIGLALLAIWLLRYDVARVTVRKTGLTRFIAICLLLGYGWLAVGGLALAYKGQVIAGFWYDAVLHAILVGFVFSMVFGHAPIIFSSVLGVPSAWRAYFYIHVAVLHFSLLARIAGDIGAISDWRRWGGLGNAFAVVLFLIVTVGTTFREYRRRSNSISAKRLPLMGGTR